MLFSGLCAKRQITREENLGYEIYMEFALCGGSSIPFTGTTSVSFERIRYKTRRGVGPAVCTHVETAEHSIACACVRVCLCLWHEILMRSQKQQVRSTTGIWMGVFENREQDEGGFSAAPLCIFSPDWNKLPAELVRRSRP